MTEELPPEPKANEPDVQGLPRSLVTSLGGMAVLLLLAGIICAIYAAWDSFNEWVKPALILLLPLLILCAHTYSVRRRGEPVFSTAFWAFLAANVIVLPLGIYMAVYISPILGVIAIFIYAMTLIWYGAFYRNAMAISAACSLAFTAALSIPVCFGPGVVASAVLLIILGLLALGAALLLSHKREERLARMRLALKKQELSRTAKAQEKEST